jgi:hypothetical protein
MGRESPRERPFRGLSEGGIPVCRGRPGGFRGVGGVFRASRVHCPVGHCVVLGGHRVAGRFAFPAVLLDLGPLPARSPRGSLPLALDRLRGCACAPSVRRSVSALMAFSSPSKRSRLRWNSSRLPKKSEFLLSWDSPHLPLCRFHRSRPLREACASVGSGLRGPDSCSALVVSHHLDGLLRVRVAGLLHPASGSGVRRVSGRSPVPCGAGGNLPFPAPR